MKSHARQRAGVVPFQPPVGWWWEWRDEGRVIVWREQETTIAFREEVEGIVGELAPEDPPVAGSIVLLLAACRDDWHDPTARAVLHELVRRCGGGVVEHGEVADVVGLLGKVRALPEDLRGSYAARKVLAAMALETPAGRAPAVGPAARASGVGTPRHATLAELRREWQPLRTGLVGLDEGTLRTRVATGLDTPPSAADPVDLPLPPETVIRGVPPELLDDPETSAVAALAREVMAAVTLPRRLEAPVDRPEGGFADIANRGSLDRLLLSELAHDASIFAARVALGEALYLRRELSAPPPLHGRTVLLDSGVRMWGVPRAYAAAVALALRAQAGPGGETAVFRAGREGLVPVDLATKEGLVDHLRAIEINAHPGLALAAFAAATPPGADAVLVTCEEALADPEFQPLAAACPLDVLHVVTVARDGRLRLLVRSRRGTRVVREAILDAAKLLAAGPAPKPVRPLFEPASHDLPAIFGVDPFPLRLSHQADVERTWRVDGVGAFTFTEDGRLLFWDDRRLGARQIATGLPRGRLIACEPMARGGQTLAVVGKLRPEGLSALSIDCRSFRVGTVQLDVDAPGFAIGKTPIGNIQIVAGRILIRNGRKLVEIDPHSGLIASACAVPSKGRQIGRIVQDVSRKELIVLAASPARVERVAPKSLFNALAVFETAGIEGITIVTREANLITGAAPRGIDVSHGLQPPWQVAGVSRDGQRFALAGGMRSARRSGRGWRIIDVSTGSQIVMLSSFRPRDLEMWMSDHNRCEPFASFCDGVRLGADGELEIGSPGPQGRIDTWTLTLGKNGLEGRMARPSPGRTLRAFESADGRRPRHGLRSVRFADGTTVWHDLRGLFHFRSSVRTLPEVSLVMVPDHDFGKDLDKGASVAGWLSDGRVFGNRYFHDREATDDVVVWTEVLRPLLAAIRD
ncbi:MAG: hypothetical protein DWI01_04030 [Planctomycetota bacterium]|nr:MAG: hypothetical protein DWI01_04030 [Planctomycetota bacterium]